MIRALRVAIVLAVVLVAGAAPASAHDVIAGADLRMAQTIAGAELTLVIKATRRVPGPLQLDVVAYQPVRDLPVAVEVRSTTDGRTVSDTVRLAAPGPRSVVFQIRNTGPHELTLRAGGEVAVLPFRVLVPGSSPWQLIIYLALFLAGTLLVGGLITGATARRTSARVMAGGAVAGVCVAATLVVLEPQLPPAEPIGAAPVATGGLPYVQGVVSTVPAEPAAGQEFTVRVTLIDGSTGLPVDDLAVHHEAQAHLIVTSADGGFFRHVHPLRTAPGRLEVRLTADRPGRYLAHAEFERTASGGQIVAGEFAVAGTGQAAAPAGVRQVSATAGRPATIEVETGGGVRPWLGMSGHLIVRSLDGRFLGHVHEMGAPGSRLRFTFSFPAPGRYLAWAQYAKGWRIETVPLTVEAGA